MNFDRLGSDEEFDATASDASAGLSDEGVDPVFAEEFGITDEPKSGRRIGDGTIAVAGALLIAGIALMGMRWLGSQHAFLARDATVEAKVTAFLEHFVSGESQTATTAAADAAAADLAAMLDDDRTVAQVPLEMVKKNPFLLIEEVAPVDVEGVEAPVVEDEWAVRRREAMRRYRELEDFALDIQVSSIMGRDGNRVAIVEGQVVKVGDQIEFDTGEMFDIVRINAFDVIMESEGFEFMVEMNR